jgi:hypothetical protein
LVPPRKPEKGGQEIHRILATFVPERVNGLVNLIISRFNIHVTRSQYLQSHFGPRISIHAALPFAVHLLARESLCSILPRDPRPQPASTGTAFPTYTPSLNHHSLHLSNKSLKDHGSYSVYHSTLLLAAIALSIAARICPLTSFHITSLGTREGTSHSIPVVTHFSPLIAIAVGTTGKERTLFFQQPARAQNS